jgi:hypothetical protein
MATKYDKMTTAQLKSILKKNGINFPTKGIDKDTLADAVHQFDTSGMVKKLAGGSVGRANYMDKKKPKEKPMYDPRKTTVKPKKKTVKKKAGGSIGCSHNRLY